MQKMRQVDENRPLSELEGSNYLFESRKGSLKRRDGSQPTLPTNKGPKICKILTTNPSASLPHAGGNIEYLHN